ncbi:MAG: pyridoxal phosphate-dependent aminotransferase [Pararhizobium sp.]
MAGFQRFTPLVESLPATVPFVGPETQERARGGLFRARLGANESGFGPAPSVVSAIADAAAESWKYCDPENFDLKTALARHLGLGFDNLVIGEGIDGLLGLIVRMAAAEGATVVTSRGAYPTFNYHVAGFGARLVAVPYRDDREDIEALAAVAVRDKAAIVYLSNPDNPMGSWWPAAAVADFARSLPETTLVVLDEAYSETAPADALPPIDALIDRPNVIRLRTFSKANGLAGLRVGYAFGEATTIRAFDKVRNHFGVTRISQVAAAAALADPDHLRRVVAMVAAARDRIGRVARANGFTPLPSATNFVTVDCGKDGVHARAVLSGLIERGVFVRMPGVAPLDRCIRISAGPDAELDILEETLPEVLAHLRDDAERQTAS